MFFCFFRHTVFTHTRCIHWLTAFDWLILLLKVPADSVSIRIYSGIARFPCDSMAFLFHTSADRLYVIILATNLQDRFTHPPVQRIMWLLSVVCRQFHQTRRVTVRYVLNPTASWMSVFIYLVVTYTQTTIDVLHSVARIAHVRTLNYRQAICVITEKYDFFDKTCRQSQIINI